MGVKTLYQIENLTRLSVLKINGYKKRGITSKLFTTKSNSRALKYFSMSGKGDFRKNAV